MHLQPNHSDASLTTYKMFRTPNISCSLFYLSVNCFNLTVAYGPWQPNIWWSQGIFVISYIPLRAKSLAVSLPMPVFPPVIMTVFPSSLALLLHTTAAKYMYGVKSRTPVTEKYTNGTNSIFDNKCIHI